MKKGKMVDALLAGHAIRRTEWGPEAMYWHHTLRLANDGSYRYTFGPDGEDGMYVMPFSATRLPEFLNQLDLRGWKILDRQG